VIPYSVLWKFWKLLNDTFLVETACAGYRVMATFRSAEWFEATRGLRNEGADVLRLSKRDVSKEELGEAFGPKSSKNGWRYDYRLSPEAAREVEELYCRVTSKKKKPTMRLLYSLLGVSFLRVRGFKSIGQPLLHICMITERRCAL
jgi:hypothetical protein